MYRAQPKKKRSMRFYEGGFKETMDRREAAMILGIRQSASRERITDAHRNLLRKNHPDMGGSTFLTTKINDAKDVLLGRSKAAPKA